MSFKPKRLAWGALNATAGTSIYQLPRGKIASLRVMRFHNSGGVTRIVKVAFNFGGTSVQFEYASLATHETLLIECGDILEGTDSIEAYQDAGTDVNFVISGLLMDE